MTDKSIPVVSVCSITYNHAPYIRKCLDGFIMQKTDFPFEVLIHDDASRDGTEQIIREYELLYPRIIKPQYEKENQWVKGRKGSAVFNLPRARGRYIAFCEGDDHWIDPLKLQKQVDFLEQNPDYGLTYGNTMILTLDGRLYRREPRIISTYEDILRFNGIGTATICFRRDVYDRFILETTDVSKEWSMADYPFYLWLFQNSKMYRFDDCFAVYLKHEGSSTDFKDFVKGESFILSIIKIKTYFYSFYRGLSPLSKFVKNEYESLFKLSLQFGKLSKCVKYFQFSPLENIRFTIRIVKLRLLKQLSESNVQVNKKANSIS